MEGLNGKGVGTVAMETATGALLFIPTAGGEELQADVCGLCETSTRDSLVGSSMYRVPSTLKEGNLTVCVSEEMYRFTEVDPSCLLWAVGSHSVEETCVTETTESSESGFNCLFINTELSHISPSHRHCPLLCFRGGSLEGLGQDSLRSLYRLLSAG